MKNPVNSKILISTILLKNAVEQFLLHLREFKVKPSHTKLMNL